MYIDSQLTRLYGSKMSSAHFCILCFMQAAVIEKRAVLERRTNSKYGKGPALYRGDHPCLKCERCFRNEDDFKAHEADHFAQEKGEEIVFNIIKGKRT